MRRTTFAGRMLQTACFFISTFMPQEDVDELIHRQEQKMYQKGFVIEETVIDTQPQRRYEIDRKSISSLLGLLETGQFGVLLVRSMDEICSIEEHWERFIDIVTEMGVRIYCLETQTFLCNNREEC
jgi:DNA invertase Pin-like site-specific DNA recombinase